MAVIDLPGRRFTRLLVLSRGPYAVQPSGRTQITWLCRCDCGTEKLVRGEHLRSGRVQSCGCLRREVRRASNTKRLTKLIVTYGQAHLRLKVGLGRAPTHSCADCGIRPGSDWSYDGKDPDELREPRIDGPGVRVYSLKFEHYAPRCKPCHEAFDVRLRRERRSFCEAAR